MVLKLKSRLVSQLSAKQGPISQAYEATKKEFRKSCLCIAVRIHFGTFTLLALCK